MIYIVLAIITSTLIIIAFKVSDNFKVDIRQAIVINYLVAFIAGLIMVMPGNELFSVYEKPWYGISWLIGLSLIVAFVLFGLTTSKTGVSITAISSRMSVIIPVTLGFVAFHDTLNSLKILGIAVALVAFFLTFYSTETKKKSVLSFLPLMLFFAVGINDSLIKVAEYHYVGDDFELFLSLAFFHAFLIGIIFIGRQIVKTGFSILPKNIFAGLILGLLNWFSTLFFLKGLSEFEVSFFVPVYNVGVVVLAAISGFLLFREKISLRKAIGIGLAVVAILLLSKV